MGIVFCLLVSMAFPASALAQSAASAYTLSEESIAFLKEHHVEESLISQMMVVDDSLSEMELLANSYEDSIASLKRTSAANGFTDEQIQAYVQGLISKPTQLITDEGSVAAAANDKPKDEGLADAVRSLTAEAVKVALPEHAVTINGHVVDSRWDRYPLVVYQGITYLPLTDEIQQFVGLEQQFYQQLWKPEDGRAVWFIGLADRTSSRWPSYPTKEDNKRLDSARVLEGRVAVNTIFDDTFHQNQQLTYPLLQLREVVYLPLTYQIVVEDLGWIYAYDDETGLVIDSTDPLKPRWEDERIPIQSPNAGLDLQGYTYYPDGYLGYPRMSVGSGVWKIEYKQKGQPLRVVDISKTLWEGLNGDVVFNLQWDELGRQVQPDRQAWVENNTACIICAGDVGENWLVTIDMDTAAVTSTVYPLQQAK